MPIFLIVDETKAKIKVTISELVSHAWNYILSSDAADKNVNTSQPRSGAWVKEFIIIDYNVMVSGKESKNNWTKFNSRLTQFEPTQRTNEQQHQVHL